MEHSSPFYHHTPVGRDDVRFLGQGGDAPGNMVFPHYSDNDSDDPDTQRLADLTGHQIINKDIYAEYGNGVNPSPEGC